MPLTQEENYGSSEASSPSLCFPNPFLSEIPKISAAVVAAADMDWLAAGWYVCRARAHKRLSGGNGLVTFSFSFFPSLPFPPLSALALLVCGSSYNELIYSHTPSPYVPNKLEQVRMKEKGKKRTGV